MKSKVFSSCLFLLWGLSAFGGKDFLSIQDTPEVSDTFERVATGGGFLSARTMANEMNRAFERAASREEQTNLNLDAETLQALLLSINIVSNPQAVRAIRVHRSSRQENESEDIHRSSDLLTPQEANKYMSNADCRIKESNRRHRLLLEERAEQAGPVQERLASPNEAEVASELSQVLNRAESNSLIPGCIYDVLLSLINEHQEVGFVQIIHNQYARRLSELGMPVVLYQGSQMSLLSGPDIENYLGEQIFSLQLFDNPIADIFFQGPRAYPVLIRIPSLKRIFYIAVLFLNC